MKIIYTKKKEEIYVDDEDYEWLSKHKWCLSSNGYALRTIKHNGKRKKLRMHRLIMNLSDQKVFVDHINGNKLDNTRSNLRLCTNAENTRNRGANKNNISGIKGLCYDKRFNRWKAQISLNGKDHKKYFYCNKHGEELAKVKAIQWLEEIRPTLHGEFARN